MFCNKCGKELPNNVKFCTYCGEKITNAVPVQRPAQMGGRPTNNAGAVSSGISSMLGWAAVVLSVIVSIIFISFAVSEAEDVRFAFGWGDDSTRVIFECVYWVIPAALCIDTLVFIIKYFDKGDLSGATGIATTLIFYAIGFKILESAVEEDAFDSSEMLALYGLSATYDDLFAVSLIFGIIILMCTIFSAKIRS